MSSKNVLIMGAAGRDFHNFNVVFRDNPDYNVVAFTATQIPNIHGRMYPAELAGKLYPKGIKIFDESELVHLIKDLKVDEVVFSYSDVPFNYVMTKASIVNAAGASFKLLGAQETMIKHQTGHCCSCGPYGIRKIPDLKKDCQAFTRCRQKGSRNQASYALR